MELTEKMVRHLWKIADCVTTDGNGSSAQVEITLDGKSARTMQRLINDDARKEKEESRRALVRCKQLARQGDPQAIIAIGARRDLRAHIPLTIQQCAALVNAGISEI